jgi:hypothetical protein
MINSFITEKIKNANLVPQVHRAILPFKIEVYNICHLHDAVDPTWSIPYDEFTKIVKEWCELNEASFYAAPREKFSYLEAMKLAITENKTKVLVEDLS